jgi:hypothetical protein
MVQTTTVAAYAGTDEAHAVAPKPSATNVLLTASTLALSYACSQRVSGTVTKTMSSPLRASSPICTGSADRCCMNTSANRNVRPTTIMKTRSRKTSASEPGRSPSTTTTSGRDSGTLRNTSTANTRVVAASARNSVR